MVKAGLDFAAQAQLGGVAQVLRLVGPAGGGQDVALVAVEQGNGHGQADDIDPLAVGFAVLATHAHRQVGNAPGSFQVQRGFFLSDLQPRQTHLGGLGEAAQQQRGRRDGGRRGGRGLDAGKTGLWRPRDLRQLLKGVGLVPFGTPQFKAHL
ncbi:hypothetical protein D3C78_963360 [compost metagenome]